MYCSMSHIYDALCCLDILVILHYIGIHGSRMILFMFRIIWTHISILLDCYSIILIDNGAVYCIMQLSILG